MANPKKNADHKLAVSRNLEKELKRIKKDVLLKDYTTFKIGGPAKYFYVAKDKESLIKAIEAAKGVLPFFILGGGSNLLAIDQKYQGIVIQVQGSKLKIQNCKSKFKVFCESGLPLIKLISELSKIGATGLEWAAGIPRATVGGAIRGNAGALGSSMSDSVRKVEVYNSESLKREIYNLKDCRFSYRESVFKRKKELIILSAELEFKKMDKDKIKKNIRESLSWRKKHQPLEFFSAGSVFKNPLKETEKFSAGYLIEQSGLKGKRIGNAQISEKHANFIINLGKASSKDIVKLIESAKKKVKRKFNIELEEEIEYLG